MATPVATGTTVTAETNGDHSVITDSCMSQIMNFHVDMGNALTFDMGSGALLVTNGEVCWASMLDMLEQANQFVAAQLPMVEAQGIYPESFGLPTSEEYTEAIAYLKGYTEGDVMIASWSWPADSAANVGDSVGVCVTPSADQYMSCWTWTRADEYGYEPKPKSYLVDPKTLDAATTLDSLDEVSAPLGLVPGTAGEWMCVEPYQMWDREMTTCMRLLPTADTPQDPSLQKVEDLTVLTYMTSRKDLLLADSKTLDPEVSVFKAFSISMNMLSNSAASSAVSALVALSAAALIAF